MPPSSPPPPASLSAAVRQGWLHHRAGRLSEAAACYRQAHLQNPRDADALALLGILARRAGRPDAAVQLTALAIRLCPRHPGFRLGLAHALLAAGRHESAARCCRSLLALYPAWAAAWCCFGDIQAARANDAQAQPAWKRAIACGGSSPRAERALGHLLCRQGNFLEAARLYRAGLAKCPKDASLRFALAAALAAAGQSQEAKRAYCETLRLQPAFPEALLNLGNLYYDEGRFAHAAVCCSRALALRPGYAKAWCNLGNALQQLGGIRAAARCYRRTLAIDPSATAAWHNLGNACMARRDFRTAEDCFRRTLQTESHAAHHNSLGNALLQQRREEEAAACYRRALQLDPAYGAAHTNLANVLMRQGRSEEMLMHYQRALELDPGSAGGHYNLALAYLRQGRFREGWLEHEWRWRFRELHLQSRTFSAPQWRGQPLRGETILLHAEQGLGDTLQFVRYAPLVAQRGGSVLLEVQPRLKRLLRNLPGVRVLARGEALPEFAWHCPLMSLPLAFGSELDTIPARMPYLCADAAEAAGARQRWPGAGLRVGLCWAGNPQFRSDEQRSMPLRALLPLARIPGVSWFSLQKGPAAGQIPALVSEFSIADACSASRDMAETAALVATLDLATSVDTSIAHLAGAMGIPLWVVLPYLADWRWMDHREDSLWYPAARLFRQAAPGDWSAPVAAMQRALTARPDRAPDTRSPLP